MGLLTKIFGKKEDSLAERADSLVGAARVHATGMYTPLLDRHPLLREVELDRWDFIVAVASVFIAATRLNNLGLPPEREDQLMEAVAARLQEWDRDGVRAFEDCKGLFESEYDRLAQAGHEPRFVASDALGIWIVWNVLGRQPETREEVELVRAVGALVTSGFFDWWSA